MSGGAARRRGPLSRRALLGGGLAGLAFLAAGGCRPVAGPPTPPLVVDTLDFFLQRRGSGLTGSHHLVQTLDLDRRQSVYVKGEPARFEVHAWDDDYIYQLLDYDPERAYRLTPGVWLARRMAAGDELVAPPATTITWYTRACAPSRTEPYSYTVKLEHHLPAMDCGGDLGRQEAIVVRYLPAGGRAERFYYARGWGWVAWEEYDDAGRLRHRTDFNRTLAVAIEPALRSACATLVGRPPTGLSAPGGAGADAGGGLPRRAGRTRPPGTGRPAADRL
jgi:hypothetical protein